MAIATDIRRYMEDSSWIRKMFEIGIQLRGELGDEKVFDLSLGNPIMEPPTEFLSELRRVVDNTETGKHRYMPNAGYTETREAIASQLAEETHLPYKSSDVLMCVGAGGGINVVLHALLNPGDEVIIFKPFFAEYLFYAYNHQGAPRMVECDDQFVPNLRDLEDKITAQTKVVMLNSPNNPSGVVYSIEFLKELTTLLSRKSADLGTEIFIISDEPYRKLIFDELLYPFPQSIYDRTITVTSHSKDLAIPGERIGYVAINPSYSGREDLMNALIFCNRVLGFVNAPALMQHVVRNLQKSSVQVSEYQRKRDFMFDNLIAFGYDLFKPQGAFYMFPKSPLPQEMDSVEFLQAAGVLVVPGRGFGLPGYFRLSFCVEDTVLQGSLNGFSELAKRAGLS